MKQTDIGSLPPRMLIRATDVSLGYEGRTILEGINFSLYEGEYLCVVGENGSGKSTLMNAILGLHPLAGGTLELADSIRGVGIGYLPQQTPAQRDFPASVQEVVLSGCLRRIGFRPFFGKHEKRLAADAMTRLGITPLAGRCYRELSGGQQQRVLLARAFCAADKLLLLDEPIAGLDPVAMQEMYHIIAEMNRPASERPLPGHPHLSGGVAVVMVSHDIAASLQYADHILHLGNHGAWFGTTAAYLETADGKRFTESAKEKNRT